MTGALIMTPKQLARARQALGLTLEQMATMLGYQSESRDGLKIMGHKLENGGRPIREPQRRLVEAYLSGYRPDDWPT